MGAQHTQAEAGASPFRLSVKVLIRDGQGRCLVLRRSQASKNNKGQLDFPGGKIDPGETFDEALLRETVEETGLSIRLTRVAGHAEAALPELSVAYILMEGEVVEGEVLLSSEHDAFQWLAPEQLPTAGLCPQFVPFAEAYVRSLEAGGGDVASDTSAEGAHGGSGAGQ